MQNKPRLYYFDNIRLMVILLVIVHHVAMVYGGIGRFYYKETQTLTPVTNMLFNFIVSFQQSWFMNLLFIIGGYFAAESFARKGFGVFIAERAKRLLIPVAFSVLFIQPIPKYVLGGLFTLKSPFDILTSFGIMWYCFALFCYCAFYALFMQFIAPMLPRLSDKLTEPTDLKGLFLVGTIWVSTFAVRTVFPLESYWFGLQLSYYAAYTSLFIFGALAYHYNMFEKMDFKRGAKWLAAGLITATLGWFGTLSVIQAHGDLSLIKGGFTWEALLYSAWDSFCAVSMGLGVITLFKDKLNYQNDFVNKLCQSSFAIFVMHPLIVVPICILFKGVAISIVLKFAIISPLSMVVSYIVNWHILRHVPILNSILGFKPKAARFSEQASY